MPYHALYRHDFAAKSKPDVHKAWLVLMPWALLLYKSPAHMKHRPFMVIKHRMIATVHKRECLDEPHYLEIMTIDMDFINLFVCRDPVTRKPIDHPWAVTQHELHLWKALINLARARPKVGVI